jgi:hypothetical protein
VTLRQVIIILLLSQSILTIASGQINTNNSPKHYIGGQLGGQSLISLRYEYSLLQKSHYILNAYLGAGLNQSGDTEMNQFPIYGIHTGITNLIGSKHVYFQVDINPSTYFHHNTTFVNLNGWFGIRIQNIFDNNFCFGAGYTPILYKTYSDPDNSYVNAFVGLFIAGNF